MRRGRDGLVQGVRKTLRLHVGRLGTMRESVSDSKTRHQPPPVCAPDIVLNPPSRTSDLFHIITGQERAECQVSCAHCSLPPALPRAPSRRPPIALLLRSGPASLMAIPWPQQTQVLELAAEISRHGICLAKPRKLERTSWNSLNGDCSCAVRFRDAGANVGSPCPLVIAPLLP